MNRDLLVSDPAETTQTRDVPLFSDGDGSGKNEAFCCASGAFSARPDPCRDPDSSAEHTEEFARHTQGLGTGIIWMVMLVLVASLLKVRVNVCKLWQVYSAEKDDPTRLNWNKLVVTGALLVVTRSY